MVGLLGAGASLSPAAAQVRESSPVAVASPASRPVASALHVTEAPVIDGALDDRMWRDATPFAGFVQAEPFEGQPGSESTDVRILYDDDAIYVGVLLHDRDPSQIVTTDTRRDASLGGMDSFQMIFDTFRDQQNGFVFGTNAAGIQYDAQVRDQGDPAASWDGSWEVRTSSTATGWSAEFRIPLRTLRYGPAPQTWGVNFFRNIQRTRERTYWAPLARIYDLERLSSAGELQGLNLQTPRNFKLLPYVVSSANRSFTPGTTTDLDGDIGFDAKFGITPGLNLDATYNTDFAQVEVDTQQINLSRFNLRFPEKRPFFLENSGLFTIGKDDELDLFFSRRIGLDENGLLVPLKGGGRLSGKVNGLNVGVLNMQTAEAGLEPANNFSALRVSRELPNRSGIGAMFVNRTATGDLAGSRDWNRTWGADGRLGVGEHFTLAGFGARTETPGLTGRDYAYNVDSEYNDGRHRATFEYGRTGEDFNPEVGFLENEDGYRRVSARFFETMRQDWIRGLGFREWNPHATYTRYDYLDGGLNNAELHIDNHWDWENGNRIDTALNGSWEGFRVPFEIYPGVIVPVGEHGGLRFKLNSNTDRRKPVFARLQWDGGRFLTGNQNSPTLQLVWQHSGRFTIDTNWAYRGITLPEGAFHTNLANMRVTYNFTPSVFVQSLIQYNDRTDRWSTNLRFHVLETAGTGLFVVYNDTESLEGLGPINRAFIVKYVRQFDILK
ncbi:MAG TPA: DUF5916 domain-containing protein [Vicinamibacterales bacterium]|nr:DUF5916 domain-containing protein [Vicinamibacterales bacterium]